MDNSRMTKVKVPVAEISLVAAGKLDALMAKTPGLNTAMKVEARVKSVTGRTVGHSTIRRIRKGLVNPTLSNLHDIACAFGLQAADLLRIDNQPLVAQPVQPYVVRPEAYEKIITLLDAANDAELLMALGAVKAALDGHRREGPQQKKSRKRAG